jgi:hypothetical protein
MTTIRWPQIRLGICAVLLTGLLGEWIYILLQPSSDSKNPNALNIVYPPQVPQQFQIQNVVKDTKGSMYLLARVLL